MAQQPVEKLIPPRKRFLNGLSKLAEAQATEAERPQPLDGISRKNPMAAKSRDFQDDWNEDKQSMEMSDAEVEALMAGNTDPLQTAGPSRELPESGDLVQGTVIDYRGGDILVELDSKTVGSISDSEFEGGELPAIGHTIQATFERFDSARDHAILTVKETRKLVLWDDMRVGMLLEGAVLEVNKGGLTLDIRGIRAFMPISQIERTRVEDASSYVGSRMLCEVTSFNKGEQNLVVNRRNILDREAEENKGQALARLSEGEVLQGKIVNIMDSLGAFIDLGGVEGLLHDSKIRLHRHEFGDAGKLHVGQQLEVEIAKIDRDRGRIALEFHRVTGTSWGEAIESYSDGDEATGWVTSVVAAGAFVSLEEGVEGLLPREEFTRLESDPNRGMVLRVRVRSIDRDKQEILLTAIEENA